jgi:hypothetical protein
MKRSLLAFAIFLLCSFSVLADDGHHHEDLTVDQLGTAHFSVSCTPAVQKPFERGVALLHSFWYEEAEKEFQDIAKNDPQCAMAHELLAGAKRAALAMFPDKEFAYDILYKPRLRRLMNERFRLQ